MATPTRPFRHRAHSFASRFLLLRLVTALALVFLSFPLTLGSAVADDGDPVAPPETSATTETVPDETAAEPEATEPPAAETVTQEPAATEEPTTDPASEPAVDDPAAEDPAPPTDDSTKAKTSDAGDAGEARTVEAIEAPTGTPGVCDTNSGTGKVTAFEQNTAEDESGAWINGALNDNNSNYAEGDFVPHRVTMSLLQPGENELEFTYDVMKSGKWAYDYVANQVMSGATITNWAVSNGAGPVATVKVTFFVPADTDGNATLTVDAHVASELDHGAGTGAGSISGAPYHVSLQLLNCASAGQQDNQMMASAIEAGEIEVIKDATPADGTDFNFGIVPGGAAADSFNLDDSANGDTGASLADRITFRAAPGSYTISENNLPAGWNLADIACLSAPMAGYGGDTSGAGVTSETATSVTITIVNRVRTSCTFVNAKTATLTLLKVVDNGATGATHVDTDWTLSATDTDDPGNTTSGTEGDPSVTGVSLAPGSYTLSEDGPSGYTASAWSCSPGAALSGATVTLAHGDQVTCTITNTARQPSLELVKVVEGGDAVPADWDLSADTDGDANDLTGAGGFPATDTVIGDYDLSESNTSAGPGYTASAWNCGNATMVDADTVHIGLGQHVTCTITNTAQPGTWQVSKDSDPASGSTVEPGDVVTYTVTVEHTGGINPTDISVIDDLSDVLDDATLVAGSITPSTGTAEVSGTDLVWNIATLDGTQTITYQVSVDDDAFGVTLRNLVTSDGSDGCPYTDADCDTTEHFTPKWNLTKSSDPADGSEVMPGDAVTYTLVVENSSLATVEDATVVDDISDVLDNATLTQPLPAGLTLSGTTLTWAVPTIAAGDPPATVSYTVTVNDDQWSQTLHNVATPGQPAGECTSPADCDTTHETPGLPSLTLLKVVDNGATGATHVDTDWTLSATDTDDAANTISGAEGDPSVTGAGIDPGSYQLSEAGPAGYDASAWTCQRDGYLPEPVVTDVVELSPDEHVVCTITNTAQQPTLELVKVVDNGATDGTAVATDWTLTADTTGEENDLSGAGGFDETDTVIGDYDLSETNTSAGPGYDAGDWVCEGADIAGATVHVGLGDHVVCTITNTAQPEKWRVGKSSDPVSGSTVEPGDVVTYTVTVEHTGGVNPTDIVVMDDLSDVLDDATLVAGSITPSTGTAEVSGTSLVWSIPELSGDATVTYQVTVDDDAFGVTLKNVVTSDGSDGCPSTDADCDTTEHFTPKWNLTKSSDPADGSEVMPGETVTYTLTAENTSDATVEGATVVDDISDVLDNATLTEPLAAGLTLTGSTLTWAVPTIAAGDPPATVSYSVTVNDDQWNQTLHNVATPGQPSGECLEAADCDTTHETPDVSRLEVQKVDAESGESLPGTTFQLWNDVNGDGALDANDTVLGGPRVTDASGLVAWDDLLIGDYLVEETEAPEGYALPSQPVAALSITQENVGGTIRLTFGDPAEGQLAIVAKRQFEKTAAGAWEESDGEIGFGEQVKYVVAVEAVGPKIFHNVTVTDHIPGTSAEDVTSTEEATLVPGSARCVGIACEVTVGADGLVTWSIGTVENAGGTAEMVVTFPELPEEITYTDGVYTATLWNVGYLSWEEAVVPDGVLSGGPAVRGAAPSAAATAAPMTSHRLRSNEVVISAVTSEPEVEPGDKEKTPDTEPGSKLPNTGAAASSGLFGVAGGLALILGAWLMTRDRRRRA